MDTLAINPHPKGKTRLLYQEDAHVSGISDVPFRDGGTIMSVVIQRFEPGTLQAKVQARTVHAMQRGAIHTIPTRFELVEQNGVNFLIRIVSNLARKVQANADHRPLLSTAANTNQDPFLPYDRDLFVADISDTHVCLLNKFNVQDHHILMVTRSFQEQESVLTLRDIESLLLCLAEFEGLAFYNAGEAAGASQRHKHLQMVPLPLTAQVAHLPIEPLLHTARFEGRIGWVPGLPFSHVLVRMDPEWIASPLDGAQELLQQYLHMLRTVGLSDCGNGGGNQEDWSVQFTGHTTVDVIGSTVHRVR